MKPIALSVATFAFISMLTTFPAADSPETKLLRIKIQTQPFTAKEFRHMQLLIKRGADINATDENGETILMLAIKSKLLLTIINYLIRNGANVLAQNSSGNTALHFAVIQNNPDLINLLMENGADVFIANNKGLTPIRAAEIKIKNGHKEYQATLDLLQGKAPAPTPSAPGLKEQVFDTAERTWQAAKDAANWATRWIPGRSTSPQEEYPATFTSRPASDSEEDFEIISEE